VRCADGTKVLFIKDIQSDWAQAKRQNDLAALSGHFTLDNAGVQKNASLGHG
jgi:ketosteroid isomerase-like protein